MPDTQPANQNSPRTVIERLFVALQARDLETISQCFSPDYHGSDTGTLAPLECREDVLKMFGLYLLAFPDFQFELLEVITEGHRVVAVWTAQGTHQGPLLNIPAMHKPSKLEGTWIATVQAGVLTEGALRWDMAKLLRDLGLLPLLPSS